MLLMEHKRMLNIVFDWKLLLMEKITDGEHIKVGLWGSSSTMVFVIVPKIELEG